MAYQYFIDHDNCINSNHSKFELFSKIWMLIIFELEQ
jgi:hypothetical protein